MANDQGTLNQDFGNPPEDDQASTQADGEHLPRLPSVGLVGKLANIALDFEPVRKLGKNEAQGYSYVKAEDIAEAATRALLAEGIHVDFEPTTVDFQDRTSLVATVYGQMILTDVETGEKLTRFAVGSGADKPGDKAVAKAMTMARKYAFIHLLCIPIGDDPDESRGTRREQLGRPKLDAERVEHLHDLFKAHKESKGGHFTFRDFDLMLGSIGLDALRAHSAKAVNERLESLTEEQADALEKELG